MQSCVSYLDWTYSFRSRQFLERPRTRARARVVIAVGAEASVILEREDVDPYSRSGFGPIPLMELDCALHRDLLVQVLSGIWCVLFRGVVLVSTCDSFGDGSTRRQGDGTFATEGGSCGIFLDVDGDLMEVTTSWDGGRYCG